MCTIYQRRVRYINCIRAIGGVARHRFTLDCGQHSLVFYIIAMSREREIAAALETTTTTNRAARIRRVYMLLAKDCL